MDNKAVAAVAKSVRSLTMDAVQAANSGHPGMPMGMAELGALLYGEFLNHTPSDPNWPNRDRLVLSAGHGSMFLYSLLHLSGYEVSLEDIKNFRQIGYKTPGHPEYGQTPGVETTTGPLGQGLCNAVGMAIAEQMLGARFNTDAHSVVDHYTYAIAGDGCLMEGLTGEASSLAGHLGLGKLIVFYDANSISIEGPTDLAFTEDVADRYEAYGWQVLSGDAYDVDGIRELVQEARNDANHPTLIVLKSLIGKGSPNKAGTHGVHGAALGDEEVVLSKRELGLPEDQFFYIEPDAITFFKTRKQELEAAHEQWQKTFREWSGANPQLAEEWQNAGPHGVVKAAHSADLPGFNVGDKVATRKASGAALKALAAAIPTLVGGSADLAPSNNTALPEYGSFTKDNRAGRTLHFGVREHAMAAISNGICLHGMRPFAATFLVFSDYLRPGLRLSALMKLPVVYILTHDSVFLGEDGPTHQPIEHLAALRAIPNVHVLRPADAEETVQSWLMALEYEGPTCLALTRQGLPVFEKADKNWTQTIRRGAYIARDTDGTPDAVLVATGSEVSLALKAVEKSNRKLRVVSMLSRELFLEQGDAFRKSLLPDGVPVATVEAGICQGWERIATTPEAILSIDRFGESGPGNAVAEHLGLTVENLLARIDRAVDG